MYLRVQSFSELVRLHVVKPAQISSLLSNVVVMLMFSSLPRSVRELTPKISWLFIYFQNTGT